MPSRLRRILIVDDNEKVLDVIERLLGNRFEVRRAASGEEALRVLRDFRADLVLLDLVMTGIDGYETCRRITSDPRTMNTKVILVSGNDDARDRVRGYDVGASDYLVKPFDPDELVAKVSVFLALKSAQDESRAKSDFVANISHEIRTPMTAILGYSENLRDDSMSVEDRHQAIDIIWRNGQHLLELLSNVLDLSKLEANRLPVERSDCNPARIVDEVVALMRARADSVGMAFTVEFDGPVPARICSDHTRIKQILINLVGNALKFTESGGVRIVLRMRADRLPEPMLEIDVVDTGIGIAPEVVDGLGEPFVQADASVTRRFGGTGLGLSISKRLARCLGGDLSIRSELGKGSTFTVSVATGPLDGAVMHRDVEAAVGPRALASERQAALPRIPCRLLLVEDGIDNQRLLSFVLKKAGADVTIAQNGKIAVDTVMASSSTGQGFDVILMDMQMPVLDGYAATARLRDNGYSGPIVAVTAHAMPEDQQRCLAAGCDRFLAKPVDREALIRTIQEFLEARQ